MSVCVAPRVRLGEQPPRRAAKLVHLRLQTGASHRVRLGVQLEQRVLVRERVEDVIRAFRLVAVLLVPEDEVDPFVDTPRHVLGLERRAVRSEKGGRVAVRPRRKDHVPELRAVPCPATERQVPDVDQKVRRWGEKLRSELLDVGGRRQHALPRLRDGVKLAIGRVVPPALKPEVVRGSRAYEPVQHVPGGGVMSAVEIRRHLRELHLPHSLPQRGEPLFVEGAHRPREVPVHRGVVEVQRLRAVVAEDPGHHGPLGEIVEASPGGRVEVKEVVQI